MCQQTIGSRARDGGKLGGRKENINLLEGLGKKTIERRGLLFHLKTKPE